MVPFIQQGAILHPVHVGHTLDAGSATWALVQPLPERGLQQGAVLDMSRWTAGSRRGTTQAEPGRAGAEDGALEQACSTRHLSLLFPCRACASSETESEAGDIMDQQFEEMNNRLNSVTDPTGFLRMVRRNNLFNRCVWPCLPGGATSVTFQLHGLWWDGGLQG